VHLDEEEDRCFCYEWCIPQSVAQYTAHAWHLLPWHRVSHSYAQTVWRYCCPCSIQEWCHPGRQMFPPIG